MKALLLSSLLVMGAFSAHASEASFEKIDNPILIGTIKVTAVPLYGTAWMSFGTSVGFQDKEIVLAAKSDAQDFLAGEEATNTLVKAVDLLKAVPELSQASDEEIVNIIATLE